MRTFTKILFYIGILLLINVYGLFKSLRNPAIYSEEKTLRNRIGDITIQYPEIENDFVRRDHEPDKDYAVRMNKVVNDGFAHYWKEEGISKYHLRVPIWENYLLFAASYINPKAYRTYEFSNYKKDLERGVGLCSSHCIVLKGILNKNGIPAELFDIAGHVVLRTKVNETEWYLLDPDFGIVVPFDTAAVGINPEIVRPYYQNMAKLYYPDAKNPYTVDHVVEIYGREGNHTYTVDNWFEYFSYWAKWIIPLLLILPYTISLFRKNKPAHYHVPKKS
jgi:hypothetical protein